MKKEPASPQTSDTPPVEASESTPDSKPPPREEDTAPLSTNPAIQQHMSGIDAGKFRSIRDRYIDLAPPPDGYSKYLNLDKYVRFAMQRARRLGLEQGLPRAVFDIGTGAGYLPLVCRNLGHTVLTLDMAGNRFYEEMIHLLGIPRVTHRIRPFTPLPDLGRRFDLITAFSICFNDHKRPTRWGAKEWDAFIEELRDRHLSENGMLYLSFNGQDDLRAALDGSVFADQVSIERNGAELSLFEARYRRAFEPRSEATV